MLLVKKNERVMLTDDIYRFGKKFVQIILPAFSSLYFGLSKIWGFPNGEEVVGTCALLAVFLGAVLGISSSQFDASGAAFDGNLVVTKGQQENGLNYSFELDNHPATLLDKSTVSFKVDKRLDSPPPAQSQLDVSTYEPKTTAT